jgi:hypothetical protein
MPRLPRLATLASGAAALLLLLLPAAPRPAGRPPMGLVVLDLPGRGS